MWRKLRKIGNDLRETAEWIQEDPKVEDIEPGGGDFVITRLFNTTAGPILVDGSIGGPRITRFDEAGWARKLVWTRKPGCAALTAAIAQAGASGTEAARMAEEIEPLVAARRPAPRPPSFYKREAMKTAAVYAVPWGVGFAWLSRLLLRLIRRRS
jgi:hypothetical protein